MVRIRFRPLREMRWLVIACLAAWCTRAQADPPGWVIQTLPTPTDGLLQDLAVDADNGVHFLYCTGGCYASGTATYTVYDPCSSTFLSSLVINCTDFPARLAVSASGVPHISAKQYATYDGIDFCCDVNFGYSEYSHMAVSSTGVPAIVHRDRNFSTRNVQGGTCFGTWDTEELPLGETNFADPFMVLDDNDLAHVCYSSAPDESSIYYLRQDGAGGWSDVELVVSVGPQGARIPWMALDPEGNPCIAYRDDTDASTVKFTCRTDSGWTGADVVVDACGYRHSLVIDDGGTPHLAAGCGDIVYAKKVNGLWETTVLAVR